MVEPSTQELVRQSAAGDAGAFRCLIEQHYLLVYKMAFRRCGHREDAEDIAQQVFVKLPQKLHTFRGEASFSSWLCQVTINTARDYARKARTTRARELPFSEGFDVASDAPSAEQALITQEFYRAIQNLPGPLCDAVLLVFGENMSHKQAALVLGCAETTVSWRIFRARKLLRSLLHSGDEPLQELAP